MDLEDHFRHNVFTDSQAHRRGPVILAAIVVLILGVLGAMYWLGLFSLFSSSSVNQTLEQAPTTLEEKKRLLETDSGADSGGDSPSPAAAPIPVSTKAALLESDSSAKSDTTAPPPPPMSAEDKAKLLGGN